LVKKILLLGEYYSDNLGDGIICECVEYLLRQKFKDYDILKSDLSGRSNYPSFDQNSLDRSSIKSAPYKRILVNVGKRLLKSNTFLWEYYANGRVGKRKVINKVCNEDYSVAVFAGGQIFMDYFGIPVYRYVNLLARKNIPVVFNACGFGEIKSNLMLRLFKSALNKKNVYKISMRDSVKRIEKLLTNQNKEKLVKSYDVGLWAKDVYGIDVNNKTDIIGIGVISTPKTSHLVYDQIRNIIVELNARKLKWQLFCNGSINDFKMAIRIASSLDYDSTVVASRPQSPRELVELISSFKSIISFRLHSHIIAASLNTPSIALSWDNKLDQFFESIGFSNRCVNINLNHKDIIDLLIESERVGCNRELIEYQKNESLRVLYESVNGVL
jgi:polysaccharide pyruvyl transferase WcaK-like protein